MAEVANYVYVFGPLCWAVLAVFGGLVVTLSTQHARLARGFFILSAIPLFLVPVAFGVTAVSGAVGLIIAALSAFVLGMTYYIGIWILNEHMDRADRDSKSSVS